MARPQRRGRRRGVTLVVVLALGAGAAVWGPGLWHRYSDRVFSTDRCTVTVDGRSAELTAEQADNAALISAVALSRGLPRHAVVVALATAYQESDLRNLDIGDRDSLGLFQQRPSQGWGTEAEVMDRHFATGAFYDALVRVASWDTIPVTEAAQAVQRSAYPGAYADHEADAELWAIAFYGEAEPSSVQCTVSSPSAGSVDDLDARLLADFGGTWASTVSTDADGRRVFTLNGVSGIPDASIALWGVTVATGYGVEMVQWCDQAWTRGTSRWDPVASPSGFCGETIVLIAPAPSG